MLAMGGAVAAVESAYMKQQLVASNTRRLRAIESGEQHGGGRERVHRDRALPAHRGRSRSSSWTASAEREQIEALRAFRARRSAAEVASALRELDDALAAGRNVMPASIRAAHAGVTTGEWADALRKRFGEYRAPTGVVARESATRERRRPRRCAERVRALARDLGRPLKLLVGKPGLDGHSNGAEQIAVTARDVGIEVVYEGIRLTPERDRRARRATRACT